MRHKSGAPYKNNCYYKKIFEKKIIFWIWKQIWKSDAINKSEASNAPYQQRIFTYVPFVFSALESNSFISRLTTKGTLFFSLWPRTASAIGIPNRLFFVTFDRWRKYAAALEPCGASSSSELDETRIGKVWKNKKDFLAIISRFVNTWGIELEWFFFGIGSMRMQITHVFG